MDENSDITLKLLIVGGSGVGKTNFLNMFLNNKFNQNYFSSTGIDLQNKIMNIKNKKVRIQIWDTAGQEKYKSITKNLFLKVMGALVLYDITNEESFTKLKEWVELIKEECGRHIKILIIGNKSDLESQRAIDKEDAMKYANEEKVQYIECSSKTGENVEKAIIMLSEKILESTEISMDSSLMLDSTLLSSNIKKRKCC
jgi:small GTP-binding protein